MRPRVEWMNETDEAVLEYLEQLRLNGDERVSQSPTAIWVNLVDTMGLLEKSQSTIARRMQRLEDMGFLDKVDDKRAYYCISDDGIKYLNGELSRDEIPRPDED